MIPFQLIYPFRRGSADVFLGEKGSRSATIHCVRNKVRIKILKAFIVAMTKCWDGKPYTVTGTDVSA